jgi:hypothetical protein
VAKDITELDGVQTLRHAYNDSNCAHRVDVVSDSGSNQDVVDQMDMPYLDGTLIPGSVGNPLEVVASLAADVVAVQALDTTGEYIGVYEGAALSETLVYIIGPGSDQTTNVQLSSGSRISLRAMDASAPIGGNLVLNFLGVS